MQSYAGNHRNLLRVPANLKLAPELDIFGVHLGEHNVHRLEFERHLIPDVEECEHDGEEHHPDGAARDDAFGEEGGDADGQLNAERGDAAHGEDDKE